MFVCYQLNPAIERDTKPYALGRKVMPPDQHITSGRGKHETCVEILPHAVYYLVGVRSREKTVPVAVVLLALVVAVTVVWQWQRSQRPVAVIVVGRGGGEKCGFLQAPEVQASLQPGVD